MGIHWLAWAIIGGVMTIWSWRIGDKFALFFYAGLAFLIIGIAKALIAYVITPVKNEATPQRQHTPHAASASGMAHPAHMQRPAVPPTLNQSVFNCPRCRVQLPPSARFCFNCGLHVRQ